MKKLLVLALTFSLVSGVLACDDGCGKGKKKCSEIVNEENDTTKNEIAVCIDCTDKTKN